MAWDEEGLEDEPPPPLLPPEDRLWRHPSEVSATTATEVRGARGLDSGPPRMVTVVALTSCISVLLTLGVVAVIRPFREPRVGTETATPTGGLSTLADVAAVAAKLRPAVTHVAATTGDGVRSWGSGVIIRRDGMMLTTHHLVDGAASFDVVLDDGRALAGRLVGVDAETDLAVLDLDGEDFPTAALASDRAAMRVGQPAITIGMREGPASGGPLIRTTVVSAMGQEAGIEGRKLLDMIRTDTALEPGCDGGAVADANGRVIGIAAANMATPGGDMGLATPIDVARAVAQQLIDEGRVRRGWLGVEGRTHEAPSGVRVGTVLPDGPAAAAGVAEGDVIHELDGRRISSMADLVVRLRATPPGRETTVVVERDGARRTLRVTLGERPA